MQPLIPAKTSKAISPPAWAAMKKLFPEPQPTFVPVRAEPYAVAGECHKSVAEKVRRDGGSAQFGWVVWELPSWEVQAEFHSVWRSPDGELVDITPPLHNGPIVLFLPDARTIYEGRNIPGLHHPYDDSERCREYVEIVSEQEKILYPPGADHSNFESVPMHLIAPLLKRMSNLFRQGA